MAKHTRRQGQIIPKGDGKYLIRTFIGRDEHGKRKYISKLVHGTISQAKQESTRVLREKDTGTLVAPSKMTVRMVCEEWLAGKASIAWKTKADYESLLKLHIYPLLGHRLVQKVSHLHVKEMYGAATAAGLSSRTLQYLDAVFGQAMRYAVQHQYIPADPTKYVELPRLEHEEMEILEPDQAYLFLEKSRDSQWWMLWFLLLSTGLRPQEALAVRWEDFFPETRELRLQRALRQIAPGKYEPADMKTKQSKQPVALSESLVEALTDYRKTTAAIGGLIFKNAAGHHWDIAAVRRAWYRDLATAELPKRKLYSSRHSHLSHLLAAGINAKAVADRARHSDPTLILRTYGHTIQQTHREMADVSEGLLNRKVAT